MLYYLVLVTVISNGNIFAYPQDVFETMKACEKKVEREGKWYADNQAVVCVGLPKKVAIENGLY